MATQTVVGTVEQVNSKGPLTGQYGQFYNVGVKVNGQWFNKAAATSQPVVMGQQVSINFETVTNQNGTLSHRIIKNGLNVVGGNTTVASTPSTTHTAVTSNTASSNKYDPRGPITGNTVSKAVDLALGLQGEKTTLSTLKKAVDTIIELHFYAETQVLASGLGTGKRLTQEMQEDDPFEPDDLELEEEEEPQAKKPKSRQPKGIY